MFFQIKPKIFSANVEGADFERMLLGNVPAGKTVTAVKPSPEESKPVFADEPVIIQLETLDPVAPV